jgi:hypothetical protein
MRHAPTRTPARFRAARVRALSWTDRGDDVCNWLAHCDGGTRRRRSSRTLGFRPDASARPRCRGSASPVPGLTTWETSKTLGRCQSFSNGCAISSGHGDRSCEPVCLPGISRTQIARLDLSGAVLNGLGKCSSLTHSVRWRRDHVKRGPLADHRLRGQLAARCSPGRAHRPRATAGPQKPVDPPTVCFVGEQEVLDAYAVQADVSFPGGECVDAVVGDDH